MLELFKARTSSPLSLLRTNGRSVRRWSFRFDYNLSCVIVRLLADWLPIATCYHMPRLSKTSSDYLRGLRMTSESCTGLEIKKTKDFDYFLNLGIPRETDLVAARAPALEMGASPTRA